MQEATGFYSRAWAGERRPIENGWDFKKLVYVPGCAWRGKAVVTQRAEVSLLVDRAQKGNGNNMYQALC